MTTKYSISTIFTFLFLSLGFTYAQASNDTTSLMHNNNLIPEVVQPVPVESPVVHQALAVVEKPKENSAARSIFSTVTIQEGEPIYLELMNDYDIDKVEVGNTVQFRVTSNVLIDGKEAIRAFASASGIVSRKESSTTNTNGTIQVTVRHIRAVDGKQVLVDGPTNLTSTHIGTAVTVYVKNAIDINVR